MYLLYLTARIHRPSYPHIDCDFWFIRNTKTLLRFWNLRYQTQYRKCINKPQTYILSSSSAWKVITNTKSFLKGHDPPVLLSQSNHLNNRRVCVQLKEAKTLSYQSYPIHLSNNPRIRHRLSRQCKCGPYKYRNKKWPTRMKSTFSTDFHKGIHHPA